MVVRCQVELGEFEVAGLGDFEVAGRAGDDGDHDAGALQEAGLVGAGELVGGGFGEGAAQQAVARSLRSLRLDDALARDGCGDDGAVGGALDLLDGVHRGQADDGGAVLGDGVDGAVDGGGIDERAGGVVDEDDVVLAAAGLGDELGERVADGLLADVAALDDVDLAAGGSRPNSAICARTRSISGLRTAT